MDNEKMTEISMIDVEIALERVAELISFIPKECKGDSKEASICRRRWMEIKKRIDELI